MYAAYVQRPGQDAELRGEYATPEEAAASIQDVLTGPVHEGRAWVEAFGVPVRGWRQQGEDLYELLSDGVLVTQLVDGVGVPVTVSSRQEAESWMNFGIRPRGDA